MNALQLVGYFQDYQLTWSYLLDQLVAGLTLGSLYGLIAIGYSMVYGILKLLNFAHGEVFMIGSYIGYFTLTALGGAADPDLPIAVVIALMFAAAMLGAGGLGVVIERFAYRPLREKRAPRIAPLISALGVSFCLQQLAVICFGSIPKQYDSFAFDGGSLFTMISIGPFDKAIATEDPSGEKAIAEATWFSSFSVKIRSPDVTFHIPTPSRTSLPSTLPPSGARAR
jgi:branched-subunit amino acid ABC-type transport system permease component